MTELQEDRNVPDRLRACEAALRQIQQLARIGSWCFDVATDRLQWSEELFAIFGMKPADGPLSPELIFPRIHPDDLAAFKDQMASGNAQRTDFRIVLPDGSFKYIHQEVHVERDAAGKPVLLQGTAQDITEQKRIEEALRESERRYRAIVESQAEFVVRYQQGGILTFVNDTICRYAKMKREDLLGKSYYPFIHPDDRDAFIRKIEALDRKNPSLVAEARVVLPDGREAWHRWTHHAIFSDRGAIVEYQSTGLDATELKQAGDSLRESEGRFRALFENLSVVALVIDPKNGRILDANEAASAYYGRSREQLRSMLIWEINTLPPDEILKRMDQVKSRKMASLILQHRRADGSVRDVEVHSGPIPFQGRTALYSVVHDVTERRQAEEALKLSEERFRMAFQTSPDAIVITRLADGMFVSANKGFTEITGYTEEDVLGRTTVELNIWDDPEERKNMAAVLKSSGTVRNREARFRTKEGTSVYGLVSASVITIGGIPHLLSLTRNITERKQAEDALKESEEKFSRIFSKAPLLITLSDVDTGRLLDVNEKFLEISGYTRDEVVGRTVLDLGWISGEQRERIYQILQSQHRVTGRELSLKSKDGREVICQYNGEIISVGGKQRLLSIAQDITGRKKAESDLELFRTLMNRSNDAIFVNDLQSGRFVDMNDRACTSLGYNRDELLQMGVQDIEATFPDDRVWQDHVADVKRRGSLLLEGMHRRKDGTTFPAEISVSYVEVGDTEYMIAVGRDITERKQADAALRDRERRLAESQRIAHIGSWEHNLKTGRVFWSDELFRLLGLDPRSDPADFNRFFTMVHPDDQPALKSAIDATLRERKPFSLAYRFVLQDETIRFIDAQAELLPDESGEPVILSGTAQDITERKQAELERERLARAVSTVTEGIAMTDEQDRFIYVNGAHAKCYGYAPHELLGKTWRFLTPAEFVPLIGRELAKTLHNKDIGVWSGDAPGLRRDGFIITTEITATARWNENGEYLGHICVVRDITERKRIDQALRASEARFRSIIEHASAGILVADVNTGQFVYANAEICRMLGYRPDELLALDVSAIHPAPELKRVRKALAASEGLQTFCLRKDGATFPVEIRPVAMELDGRQCLAGFFTDITERRMLEEERLRAQKLESIGTLAGGIAHDFNNLLQGIFGYISLAKITHDQKTKSLSMLEQAEQALHRTVSLTSQLLTFSKGGKPVKKAIDLRPVIENAARFALSGSRVDYRLDLAEDLRPVEADEGQIGQVLQNIVLNADQAMPLGGTIMIAARNSAGGTGFVEISVRDSGIGIPEEYLTKIFDPYFSTKEKGSGLGLATSYSIIRNHGGEISVTSKQGKGSLFTILLPASARGPESGARSYATAPGRQGRVLVMDDDNLVRQVAYELLTGLGHDVDLGGDGGEAIEKYKRAMTDGRPFDVVILDLTVRGGMGGAETMRKLREIDPGVAGVVSSGYSADSVIADYEDYGFKACLVKPYELEKLRDVLNGLLG